MYLFWNNAQTTIDIRSKLMVQLRNDIVNEVTRVYFERRRLQIELLREPPESEAKLIETELRVRELTANIDGLTGGMSILEIACGVGNFTTRIGDGRRDLSITGLDISGRALRQARRRSPALSLVQSDTGSLPFGISCSVSSPSTSVCPA